jgi:UDP-N-acetylglucosamine acyltransferase
MSKLIDSLTGYFFPGEHATVANGASPGADHVSATTQTVDRPIGDSQDLSPAAYRRFKADPGPAAPGGLRLRDRLWLRRPVHRSAPAAQKPWGDEEVASPRIHPTAVIDARAELAADVEVGPFCVIGPNVTIGPGCKLHNHVTIAGHTTIGSDNEIFPNAVIGATPQDKKFKGEPTRLVIGDGNMLREAVTIHVGTEAGGGVPRVGDRNLLMVNCHLGHDVTLGSDCIFANNVMLAGHCHVGNRVSIMGAGALHHFVSIGDLVFIGAYSKIRHDVPPYMKVDGPDEIRGVNVVGLRRAGMDEADIAALEIAARRLFYAKKKPMSLTITELLADTSLNPRVREMVDFLRRRNLGTKGRYLESLRSA